MTGWSKVAAALRAYAPKALARATYCDADGLCCAVGVLEPSLDAIDADDGVHVAALGRLAARLGLDVNALMTLTRVNDARAASDETDAERYVRVLAWVDAQAAREVTT